MYIFLWRIPPKEEVNEPFHPHILNPTSYRINISRANESECIEYTAIEQNIKSVFSTHTQTEFISFHLNLDFIDAPHYT